VSDRKRCFLSTSVMYVWGTANPVGECAGYDGMYFTGGEINDMVLDRTLVGIPVKIEHKGEQVGHIVSAWQHSGRLDLLLSIDESSPSMATAVASHFVKGNVCKDLSLGYTVGVQQSADGGLSTGKKEVSEVSIVKRGARDDCHIHAFFGT
jgi:hypothetical protein